MSKTKAVTDNYCIFVKKLKSYIISHSMNRDFNRIKVVLVENKKTNTWLAEQLGKDQTTVSKWCTNASQPSFEIAAKIASLLDVDINDLIAKQ